ncbi:hypothetical protein LIER_37514 [Lithospermum erythrorhizon]|uniref:Uncharacterized protein n=1 Tax=Lithospermum erythrorhizon TaxID=34254 RepID=A0AAV3PPB1_LITER
MESSMSKTTKQGKSVPPKRGQIKIKIIKMLAKSAAEFISISLTGVAKGGSGGSTPWTSTPTTPHPTR